MSSQLHPVGISLLMALLVAVAPGYSEWADVGNLGAWVNSAQLDAHPSISADGTVLYFNSERPGGVGGRDIWMSKLVGWSASGPIWSTPVNPGPPLNSSYLDGHPCLSADGQTLYFISERPGGLGGTDIWVCEWAGSQWGAPENLGSPINSSYWEMEPFVVVGGGALYFSSIKPGGFGDYDIYRAARLVSGWATPENLGSTINTSEDDNGPWVDAEESVLYFHSWGHDPYGTGDLFMSLLGPSGWEAPMNLGWGINTTVDDACPTITQDMLRMYFHSNRPGGNGSHDIYFCSYRPLDWTVPVNLGPRINTPYLDGHPSISADGHRLYLNSERPGGIGGRDIWVSRLLAWVPEGPLWSIPSNIGYPVNTISFDGHPCISSDGQQLFLVSDRSGGFGAHDIYVSPWEQGVGWGEPQNVGQPVNSGAYEISPHAVGDGSVMYFASDRAGGYGGYDIYRTAWSGAQWSVPVNLGPHINTGVDDDYPWVNEDEQMIVFQCKINGSPSAGDLFYSVRHGGVWQPAQPLDTSINTPSDESAPSLSADLAMMYLHSNRPGGYGSWDIYLSQSTYQGWVRGSEGTSPQPPPTGGGTSRTPFVLRAP